MITHNYHVALPQAYALTIFRREVHKDARRLGANPIRRMAERDGVCFCVFSFATERHRGIFMRRHGGKIVDRNNWRRVLVK